MGRGRMNATSFRVRYARMEMGTVAMEKMMNAKAEGHENVVNCHNDDDDRCERRSQPSG